MPSTRHHGDQCRDHVRIELAPALALQLIEDPFVRTGGLIRPPRAHDIEGVDHRDDASTERDLLAAETVGVTRAVEMLVVMPDDQPDVLPGVDVRENRRADLRVGLHHLAFLGGQRLRLAQQCFGDRDLADVVETGAEADDAAHAVADADVACDRIGHADEPRRVLLGLVVLGLEGVGQHHREALEHRREKAQTQRFVGQLATLECAIEHGEQVHRLERLRDERNRTRLHRLHGEIQVAKRGHDDARDHRIDPLCVGDEVDAVGVRHRVVGDHRVETARGINGADRLRAVGGTGHVMTGELERLLDEASRERIVLSDEYPSHLVITSASCPLRARDRLRPDGHGP